MQSEEEKEKKEITKPKATKKQKADELAVTAAPPVIVSKRGSW